MIIAPHGTLPVRDFLSRRDVIPAPRPMINRVEQQPLMLGIGREIWLTKKCVRDTQAGLPIFCAALLIALRQHIISQPNKPLRRNCGRRTIYGFPSVEWIRPFVWIIP